MTPTSKFVQLVSDAKMGLCALAADGTVWRWRPDTMDGGGRTTPGRWERVGA